MGLYTIEASSAQFLSVLYELRKLGCARKYLITSSCADQLIDFQSLRRSQTSCFMDRPAAEALSSFGRFPR
jgi:hypothetical protein